MEYKEAGFGEEGNRRPLQTRGERMSLRDSIKRGRTRARDCGCTSVSSLRPPTPTPPPPVKARRARIESAGRVAWHIRP